MVNRSALAGLAAVFAIGVWLVAAPFVLRYAPAGTRWTGAARLDVAVGAAVAVAGAGAFLVALTGRVRELYARAGAGAEVQSGSPAS
jgi:hypothetical protein